MTREIQAGLLRGFGKILFVFLVLNLLSAEADYQVGLDAYQAGDYDQALVEWMAVAKSPTEDVNPAILAETYYALGMLFWVGQGVQQNTTISARWLEKAADLAHPGAQTKLGFLFSTGQGVVQSDFEALKWFQMAANQGDADAQYNLAVFYREGIGVAANESEALKWFREAASNGDAVSASIVQQYDAGLPMAVKSKPLPEGTAGPPSESSSIEQEPEIIEIVTGAKPDSVLREEWISNQNPEHYTIQVIALSQPDKLLAFMDQHPEWAPFAIYQQQNRTKRLYVLIQGDYEDVESARGAAQSFPDGLQKQDKVWIRKFLMIQGLLQ